MIIASQTTSVVLATVGASLGAVLVGGIITLIAWIVRKLNAHDTALALIINQLNPPGEPSLRSLLTEIKTEQVRFTERKDSGGSHPAISPS